MFSHSTLLSSLPIPGDMSNDWNISPDLVRNYNRLPSQPVAIAAAAQERARDVLSICLDAAVQERAEVRRFDCDNDAIGNEHADE